MGAPSVLLERLPRGTETIDALPTVAFTAPAHAAIFDGVRAVASRTQSSTRSVNSVIPPNRAA